MSYIFCAILSPTQKNLISIERDCYLLIELFAIPTAAALLQCTGVFGWGCPISVSVSLKIMPTWQLWYNALSSSSAADATTNLRIIELTWNALFKQMGSPFFGIHPMKKFPHAQLRTSTMHWSVCLISFWMQWSKLLRSRCARGNPIIVCILPLFFLLRSFIPQLSL